jgi:hypothetical protein
MTLDGVRMLQTATDGIGHLRFDTQDFGGVLPGTHTLKLDFGGNRFFAGTSAQLSITVLAAQATVSFLSGPQPAGDVTLVSKVTPVVAVPAGDLSGATLTYTLTPDGGAALPPVTAAVRSDGFSVTTVRLNAGLYTVAVTVGGLYAGGLAESSNRLLPVFDPLGYAAGFGSFMTPGAGVGLPSPTQADVAFATAYFPDGVVRPGGVLILAVTDANILFAAGLQFDWLVVAGPTGIFQGAGRLNGIPGFTYRVQATNYPGDTFKMTIWDTAAGAFERPLYAVSGSLSNGGVPGGVPGNLIVGVRTPGFPAPDP